MPTKDEIAEALRKTDLMQSKLKGSTFYTIPQIWETNATLAAAYREKCAESEKSSLCIKDLRDAFNGLAIHKDELLNERDTLKQSLAEAEKDTKIEKMKALEWGEHARTSQKVAREFKTKLTAANAKIERMLDAMKDHGCVMRGGVCPMCALAPAESKEE